MRKARARVDDVVHGQAPAPYRALDLVEGAASWSLEDGYAAEEDALAELLPGPAAQASIYAFDVVERRINSAGIPGSPAAAVAGRCHRRRADGVAARDPVPPPARGADRPPGRRPGTSGGGRIDPGRARRLAAKGRLPEAKARFLRLDRVGR